MRYNLQFLLLFLIFNFQVFCLSSSLQTTNTSSVQPQCHPDESAALLQLKTSFSIATDPLICSFNKGGVLWVPTRSWNESTNCCAWDGVTCERVSGHVISLDLRCSQLQGTLGSNSSLFSLRHLRELDLSSNDFGHSSIAPEFGNFKDMTRLDLSMSNFSGDVPLELSHLSKLVSFQLSPSAAAIRIGATTFEALARNLTNLSELRLNNIDMSSVQVSSFMNLSSSLAVLVLVSCQLHGKLSRDVFHFSKLEVLDLSVNSLSGQIPHFPLNLKQLTRIDLSFNNFIGPIQEVHNNSLLNFSSKYLIGRFPSSLTYLSLRYNSINGTIPSWIFSTTSLEGLDLRDNFLSGEMEEFLTTSLRHLLLGRNKLCGIIPRSVFQNSRLRLLDLSGNNLTGDFVVLEELSKLQELIALDLSSIDLSSSFNNSINCGFKKLSSLIFSSCNITKFPNFLMCSKFLYSLDLSSNKIQGRVPKLLWEVGKDSLNYLNLSHNFLTQMEPGLSWRNLQILDLRSNLFSGPLHISSAPLLNIFLASKNQFYGEISISSFCIMTSLQVLDLSYNNLSGKIPPCIGNVSGILTVLDLRRNRLHGNFTITFPKENILRSLNLNGNQLEGPLPISLAHCQNLEVLDLGNNLFNGAFPIWLESLPNLRVLLLRSNRFQGYIENPKTKFPFQELRIMDLSNNVFSGSLPTKLFENFKAMMNAETEKMEYMGETYYQDSVMVTMKGFSFELVKIQTILTTIDFSCNKFTGGIPKDAIGRLKSLEGLNFSHNKLEGTIPSSLRNLTNLEWLDLSSNELVGKIPIELVEITTLALLNLSHNHLQGAIPHGNQFNTFGNDSFSENFGLCGFPLSKKCNEDNDAKRPPTLEQEGDSNDANWFDWKIVSMGYACGVVIGISIGYMLLYSDGKLNWVCEKRRTRMRRQRR